MGVHDNIAPPAICWRCGTQYEGVHRCEFAPEFTLQVSPPDPVLAELRKIRELLERMVAK